MLQKFKTQLEQVEKSESYTKFKSEHPESYLSSGFVIIEDVQAMNNHDWQVDFYCPKDKKIFTFLVHSDSVEEKPSDKVFQKVEKDLEPIDIDRFSLSPEQVIELVREDNIKNNRKVLPSKIIFILQKSEGINVYKVIIITLQMSVLSATVDANTGEIIKIASQNIFDFGSMQKGNAK
ncbi:MAG: hypothetical protein WC755_05335 [Candidatus Woesearchaeota archaeon]|jgi:hypothetical protein